nr:L-2-amino-thiazoline-4-carboxylic acid hydrolase [Butyricicoccus sp. OF13-6]
MKTLVQTILPRIALYKVLQAELPAEETFTHMRTYMMDWVAAEKHAFTAKMEFVPGFYRIYSYCFLKIMRTSDLWESTQEHDKTHFSASITKCLWHTACQENGCPELCPLFCDVDDVTYGGLHKLGFSRTKTLGCGGDCCDFRFFKR